MLMDEHIMRQIIFGVANDVQLLKMLRLSIGDVHAMILWRKPCMSIQMIDFCVEITQVCK